MAEAKTLVMGVDTPTATEAELKERVAVLEATIQKYMPEFVKAVKFSVQNGADLAMAQGAFAEEYPDDEYTLLGMAIKYAGLHGIAVLVTGTNKHGAKPPAGGRKKKKG
jgi:DICT domain-containing protein